MDNQFKKELIEILDARFNEQEKKFDEKFKTIDQRFEEQEKKFDQRFTSIDQRFDSVDEKFGSVDRRFDAVDENIDKLAINATNNFNQIALQISNLETNLKTLAQSTKNEFFEINSELKDILGKIQKMEDQAFVMNSGITEMKSDLNDLRSRFEIQENRLDQLEKDKSSKDFTWSNIVRMNQEVRNRLASLERKFDLASKEQIKILSSQDKRIEKLERHPPPV